MSPRYLRAALVIAGKDLRQRMRDRSALLAGIVVPFMLAAIFSLVIGDLGSGVTSFKYAVVDADHGELAQTFVQDVLGTLQQQGVAEVSTATTEAEGRALADSGKVAATFVIPAGFTAAAESGSATSLQVIGNADSPIGTDVARAVARSYAENLTAVQVGVGAAIAAGLASPSDATALALQAASVVNPLQVSDLAASRRELDLRTFFAAGMAVFFVFFTVQFGVLSLLDERREGTLTRLLVAPVPRATVLIAKLLTSLVLGVVSMAVLVVASSLLLHAHWGSPLGVAILVGAVVLAATGVTALIATVARTAEQANSWQAIVGVVLGITGGTFFPVAQAGGLIERVSLIAPHAWFMRGVTAIATGGGVGDTLAPACAMLAFAAITGAVALARAGRLTQR